MTRVVVLALCMLSSVTGIHAQWDLVSTMPNPRAFTASCRVGDRIYVIGGVYSRTGPSTDRVEAYNWKLNSWDTTIAPLPMPVSGAVSRAVNGNIYVIGGRSSYPGPPMETVFKYDPDRNEWTTLTPLSPPRSWSGASVFDDRIYVAGGFGEWGTIGIDSFTMYDPLTDTWSVESRMPSPRAFLSTETLNGKIYAMGGLYLEGPLDAFEAFDPISGSWSARTPIPEAKFWHGSASSQVTGRIYVFGGATTNLASSPGMWSYDPASGMWTPEAAVLPTPLGSFATSIVPASDCEDCIYVLGGALAAFWNDGPGPLVSDAVYKYCVTGPAGISGGPVSGTWASGCSPYKISGDIFVPNGQTLTIEPGTRVVFTGHYQFNVRGQLLAIGTQDSMITFSAEDPGTGWNGLRFIDIGTNNDTSKVVYCRIEDGFPTGPTAEDKSGGGIGARFTDKLVIANSQISNNRTLGDQYSGGAGIALTHSSPVITGNRIMNNTAEGGHGGGIAIGGNSFPAVSSNVIAGNEAWGGGGIAITNANPVLFNNTIVDNRANHGGGVDFPFGTGTLVNTILYNNQATDVGNEVHLGGVYTASFYACDIKGGLAGMAQDHSAGAPDYAGDYIGNINADPVFGILFNIRDNSPCIGNGVDGVTLDDTWYPAPATDFFGLPRPQPAGSAPDMGAIENENGFPVSVVPVAGESGFRILSISPNPGHDQVVLEFYLPVATEVAITLHDASGRELATRREGRVPAGDHRSTWNTNQLAPGVYYLAVRTNESLRTGRVVIN